MYKEESTMTKLERSKRFTWTQFDLSNGEEEKIQTLDVPYIIYGDEKCPETGRRHLQGYLELNEKRTINGLIRYVFPFNKIFVSKGSGANNQDYVIKEAKFVFEKGKKMEQGKRNDWEQIWKDMRENPDEKIIAPKHISKWARYCHGMKDLLRIAQNMNDIDDAKEQYKDVTLRPWQADIWIILKNPVNARKAYWIYDEKGNHGKSFLTEYICAMYEDEVLCIDCTSSSDIAYAIRRPKVIIFDLARQKEDFMNYATIEQCKNGRIFSKKYQSVSKRFPIPHVLIFANFMPDYGKITKDKIILLKL